MRQEELSNFSIGIRGVVAVFLKYYQIGARGEVGKIAPVFWFSLLI